MDATFVQQIIGVSWPPKLVPLHWPRGGGFCMARKRHSDDDVLTLLREIELKLTAGDDVDSAQGFLSPS